MWTGLRAVTDTLALVAIEKVSVSEFARINASRIEKVIGFLETITKSARSNKATDAEITVTVRLWRSGTAPAGVLGVAFLLIGPEAALDPLGVAAGLGGATSMAAGTVLSRKLQPPVSALGFTAWQLTAGGGLLLPFELILEPPLPPLTSANLLGLAWLGLVGAAATYVIWFRGIARLEPGTVSMLGMMSPLTAVLLGWVWLGQSLSPIQTVGAVIVLGSVWVGQRANRPQVGISVGRPFPKPLQTS